MLHMRLHNVFVSICCLSFSGYPPKQILAFHLREKHTYLSSAKTHDQQAAVKDKRGYSVTCSHTLTHTHSQETCCMP